MDKLQYPRGGQTDPSILVAEGDSLQYSVEGVYSSSYTVQCTIHGIILVECGREGRHITVLRSFVTTYISSVQGDSFCLKLSLFLSE